MKMMLTTTGIILMMDVDNGRWTIDSKMDLVIGMMEDIFTVKKVHTKIVLIIIIHKIQNTILLLKKLSFRWRLHGLMIENALDS